MNRRELFASIAATIAGTTGLKAVEMEPRQVNWDGGDMGRATRYWSDNADEIGLFAIELHPPATLHDEHDLNVALETLANYGANIHRQAGQLAFPVFGASGGLANSVMVYFKCPATPIPSYPLSSID